MTDLCTICATTLGNGYIVDLRKGRDAFDLDDEWRVPNANVIMGDYLEPIDDDGDGWPVCPGCGESSDDYEPALRFA